MHDLQQHIIGQLIVCQYARYSELKPVGVEGNRFAYHLKRLQSDHLIEPIDGGYRLSSKGLQLADTLSLKTLAPRAQPKIVTLIAVQNSQGQWLLYRRKKQLFAGLIGFPYGKIHLGESLVEAAARELAEKTGLPAQLKHTGDTYLTVCARSGILSHMLAHVFVGTLQVGELTVHLSIGTCFWRDPGSVDPADAMPGFSDIARLVSSHTSTHFFQELSYTVGDE